MIEAQVRGLVQPLPIGIGLSGRVSMKVGVLENQLQFVFQQIGAGFFRLEIQLKGINRALVFSSISSLRSALDEMKPTDRIIFILLIPFLVQAYQELKRSDVPHQIWSILEFDLDNEQAKLLHRALA